MLAPAPASKGGQPLAADVFAESLCTYMQHAITAASGQKPQPTQASAQTIPAGQSVQQRASTPSSSQSAAAAQNTAAVTAVAKSVADFVSAVIASSINRQQAATARRALKLAQSLVEALQQQRCSVSAGLSEQLVKLT